jgi:hypothetical protein
METQYIVLIAIVALAAGGALYFYMELQVRTLRTRIVDVDGGQRFEANGFYVETQRTAKQVMVQSQFGKCVRTPLAGGEPQLQTGPLDVTLSTAGLRIEVARVTARVAGQEAPQSTGFCTITLTASDALTHAAQNLPGGFATMLTMERVPELVATSFHNFAGRVRVWVDKIEHRMELDRIEQLRKDEEGAQAAEQEKLLAEARAGKAPDAPLTEGDREALAGVQIEQWRKTAGFSGTSSEVSIDAEGRVAWFIDFSNDGRITLHADKRTIHSTLLGASIASLGGELEIGVRDDYWTEEEPTLRVFRIFKGLPPDERRAWKERLELMRDSLKKAGSR